MFCKLFLVAGKLLWKVHVWVCCFVLEVAGLHPVQCLETPGL